MPSKKNSEPSKSHLNRAVIYARYSSEKQQDISIDGQIRVCKDYALREGYTIVDVYADRALSASHGVEKREAFQQMFRDAAKGKFDAVIVYKLSRFSRNRYDSAIYKSKLRKAGVKLVSANEPISDSPEGALIEGIFESLDEFYSRNLAQDVARGMHENAAKGLSTGGTIPLGYVSVDKVLKIDPASAPAVKLAFELYADGKSRGFIADELNRRGYRTKSGKYFSRSSFNTIFSNKKYVGTYHYNGEIETPGQIPALVGEDLFQRVQIRLRKAKAAPAANKSTVPYLLSGKIFCGSCGARMCGDSGRSHTGMRYHYYTCSAKKHRMGCKMPPLRKAMLESIVIDHARSFLQPNSIMRVAKAAAEEYRRQAEDNSEAVSLKLQLDGCEKSIANIVKMVERGVASESLAMRLQDLEAQRSELSCELAEAERGMPDLTEVDILHWLSLFASGNVEENEYAESVVAMLINSVHVYENPNRQGFRIVIAYNLSGESEEVISGSDLECLVHHTFQNPNPVFIRRTVCFQIAA